MMSASTNNYTVILNCHEKVLLHIGAAELTTLFTPHTSTITSCLSLLISVLLFGRGMRLCLT